jgi:uncharacterized membrane protein YtjA (UPF0391 family)
MLTWAVIALGIAIIAGAIGYTGLFQGIAATARVVFALLLLLATVLFVLLLSGVDVARPMARDALSAPP